ncbi:ClbS/DfsB family four-helix bundle protein [Clostridium minihomine]|uniref:ClbS/DfsB family four-helix bundle protein n=1 Tax=Clostridium minihomine TaxID=2045012 RepID=UPI000C772333|nr:ClbS/DfsB family four-helix bundle protein [Clostridium minihomine]
MASYEYASKQELLTAIHQNYLKFDSEFGCVAEEDKDLMLPDLDKTPAQMLAYQLGWLNLVMSWDSEEKSGRTPQMPAPGYKWNQLGELYRNFYRTYESESLQDLRRQLRQKEEEWLDWVDSLTEQELFVQGARQWTGDKSNWPMARWIHINSAAPFQTFRAKIRKWKKLREQET